MACDGVLTESDFIAVELRIVRAPQSWIFDMMVDVEMGVVGG